MMPAAKSRTQHTCQPTKLNDAQAKDTSTPVAIVTPLASEQQAAADERAITSSTPLLVDDLSSSVISSWNVDDNNCIFIGGTYHVIAKQANFLVPCESNILTYDNAAFQGDVWLLSGSMAGLVFRANDQQFYDFGFTYLGEFFLRRHDINANGGGTYTHLVPNTTSSAIAPGRQKNTLLGT